MRRSVCLIAAIIALAAAASSPTVGAARLLRAQDDSTPAVPTATASAQAVAVAVSDADGVPAVAQAISESSVVTGEGQEPTVAQERRFLAGAAANVVAPGLSPVLSASIPSSVAPASPGCPDAAAHSPSLWYDHYADTAVPSSICPNPMRRDWDPAVIHIGDGQPTINGVVDSIALAGPFASVTCTRYRGFFRPNATGTWEFQATGDDGLDLWLGTPYTSANSDNVALRVVRGFPMTGVTRQLQACTWVPINVLSCNCQGNYGQQLRFKGPGFEQYATSGEGFFFH